MIIRLQIGRRLVAGALAVIAAAAAQAQSPPEDQATVHIHRLGSQPSQKGPPTFFTCDVRIDPLSTAPAPARVSVASVTFEPGARTAWHSHPLGQTLIVTSGVGWTQHEGEPVIEIRVGDVVWCSPGCRHWHGAMATTGMTHIAIQEALDGRAVDWRSTSPTRNTSPGWASRGRSEERPA